VNGELMTGVEPGIGERFGVGVIVGVAVDVALGAGVERMVGVALGAMMKSARSVSGPLSIVTAVESRPTTRIA
jgi:hypothetical protein